METRALSIAFFYATGTAAGGSAGPLLFGHLIASGTAAARSRGMPLWSPAANQADRDREIEIIERALNERGSANRKELARRVGARYWGPGRFRGALQEAVLEGRVRRLRRDQYAPKVP